MHDVIVLIGVGSIGQAIARRVGAGRTIVLADRVLGQAEATARLFEDSGFSAIPTTGI
ncbi:MAG: hypothetical protein IJU76_03280 [Desulfovibrionaceae bacterium]|nr:hypothetical protein [Desulfovibrionaceae bacterium]